MSIRPIMAYLLAATVMFGSLTATAQQAAVDAPATSTSTSLVAGAALVSAGSLAAAGGAIAYTMFGLKTPSCEAGCEDPFRMEKGGAIVSLVLGTAAVAVGIPLIVTAERPGPGDAGKPRTAPLLAPELRVGPGGGSVAFRF
jgi:hypothetical protein